VEVTEIYRVAPERAHQPGGQFTPAAGYDTGIYVRAQLPDGKWVAADVATLDKDSLCRWLRSRGGANRWAEDVVGILLGWGPLSAAPEMALMAEGEHG
jgi:hypothetical protein